MDECKVRFRRCSRCRELLRPSSPKSCWKRERACPQASRNAGQAASCQRRSRICFLSCRCCLRSLSHCHHLDRFCFGLAYFLVSLSFTSVGVDRTKATGWIPPKFKDFGTTRSIETRVESVERIGGRSLGPYFD